MSDWQAKIQAQIAWLAMEPEPRTQDCAQVMQALLDEIERLKNLREATEKWRIQTAEACERAYAYQSFKELELRRMCRDERDHYRDKYHECNAEIERLRAALERIVEGCDLSNEAQAIAREALDE